jgi:hypothetical protein
LLKRANDPNREKPKANPKERQKKLIRPVEDIKAYESEAKSLKKMLTTPEPFLILTKNERDPVSKKPEICTFS